MPVQRPWNFKCGENFCYFSKTRNSRHLTHLTRRDVCRNQVNYIVYYRESDCTLHQLTRNSLRRPFLDPMMKFAHIDTCVWVGKLMQFDFKISSDHFNYYYYLLNYLMGNRFESNCQKKIFLVYFWGTRCLLFLCTHHTSTQEDVVFH